MDVTIKDVAKHAGVAVSTVSRVINGLDRVSPKTRDKVNRSIVELGYIRNELAASIKTGSTRFILTIVPDIINEFYTAVVRGVESVARANGYFTLVYAAGETGTEGASGFDGRLSNLVDGVVWVPSMKETDLGLFAKKPIVKVDRKLPDSEGYSVTVDNYGGAMLLMQEFIQNGHKKIAYISGEGGFNVAVERFHGYKDALKKNRIAIEDKYICQGSWYQETGYRFTAQLMELIEPPTGIFAGNNQICIGCVQYLLEHQIEIGKEISLVGFDDSLVAQYLGPGITSIVRPTFEMGCVGAEMLVKLLNQQEKMIEQKNVIMDVTLIRRNSVARL